MVLSCLFAGFGNTARVVRSALSFLMLGLGHLGFSRDFSLSFNACDLVPFGDSPQWVLS